MDDFDDIILDDYDPFTDNDDNKGTSKSQQDDPLDPLAAPSKNKNTKKRRQDDRDDDPETVTPVKKRQPMKKLNQALLLPEGLPRLRNETPWLQFQGKGHEDADLQKLMRYYRLWALKLYPRFNFTDFSSRVLKAAGDKQCKLLLSQWREEYIFKNSPDDGGNNSQDRVTGGLSGMTLEDEDLARQARGDKGPSDNDSGTDNNNNDDDDNNDDDNDDNSDDEDIPRRRKPTMLNEDTTDDDMDDQPLFMKAPPTTSVQPTATTISVDDFFAD